MAGAVKEARRVRVFVGEDERYRGRPLFEALVLAAKEHGLAGATVYRGFTGYAPHADVSTAGILRLAENLPVVVDIVDSAERVEGFVPFLKAAVKTGIVVASDVLAEQVLPGSRAGGDAPLLASPPGLPPLVRARAYLRDSAVFDGRPAHEAILHAFRAAGARDASAHRGIMGFDRSSGVLSSRPLRFHPDLPVVVEAVGRREDVAAALPEVRKTLERGLITLTGVELHEPHGAPDAPTGGSGG
jgi:PII-like signaling protein